MFGTDVDITKPDELKAVNKFLKIQDRLRNYNIKITANDDCFILRMDPNYYATKSDIKFGLLRDVEKWADGFIAHHKLAK